MFSLCGVILFLFFYEDAAGQGVGEYCTTKSGQAGSCINIMSCPSALQDIKNKINPQICGFSGADPVVCCASRVAGGTATPQSVTPATPSYNPDTVYVDIEPQSECEPISPALTAPRNNKKAWNKCLDYQLLIHPCEKTNTLTLVTEMVRRNKCAHSADELIIGGVETTPREFPHMVLLGFGEPLQSTQWLCGGSIISEWYILTAGHCTSSREFGDVSFIRLATHKRTDQINANNVYKVASIIKHPEYRPPKKYNDIALLRTDRAINLNHETVPACLYTGEDINDVKALATGWGSTQYKGPLANTMQKVTLEKFTEQECSVKFPVGARHMEQGVNRTTQYCFGSHLESKDTCQGDSGGPLQIKNKRIDCMYTVIGITSFGKACGFVGDPGIYTRVAPFTNWIENIVWKD